MATTANSHLRPALRAAVADWGPGAKLRVRAAENPQPNGTLGDTGLAVTVRGSAEFPETILVLPYDPKALAGIDLASARVFRWEARGRRFTPIWNSGVNKTLGYFWAKVRQRGTYVVLGLPRDRLLQEGLRLMALERRLLDSAAEDASVEITKRYLAPFLEGAEEELKELRELITAHEIDTGMPVPAEEYPFGQGGHPRAFPLPRGLALGEFRNFLGELEFPPDGLPEEALFFPPEMPRYGDLPWPTPFDPRPRPGLDPRVIQRLSRLKLFDRFDLWPWIHWLFDKDWWMYQHDEQHSGRASGLSDIRSTNVGSLIQHRVTALDGPVLTKPSIVNGKIYVGTSKYSGTGGGTLFKIDLASGAIEGRFPTSGIAFYSISGIGGSPAVVGGKVYFTTVYGQVYCLDAATMTATPPHPPPLWVTDLKTANAAQNQPVNNPQGDSWSGPLVVKNKVYVGSGEGESGQPFGFVFCLDASDGRVVWLYCTNKFVDPDNPGNENQPNVIPQSAAIAVPLPAWATAAGFSTHPDPPHKGAAVWSSCAYDFVTNRIFVCTGNSRPDNPLPDERYASGMIALDADTGAFGGFFQPAPSDSYLPGDFDVDVPAGPTVFSRGGTRVVCFGSKNGSFFLINPSTLQVLGGGSERRQLLAREGGSGLPGDVGTAIPAVVPHGGSGENKWGVMGTAAVHTGLGKIYVGLGGYSGVAGFDKTPFLRALDWNTLGDAWPTTVGPDNVTRYSAASPPLYTSDEAGLSSPAVVNDVVFVSTHKIGFYALDANTGLCLWAAPGLPSGGWPYYCLGPAIYGNYVVIGAREDIRIYKLPGPFIIRVPPELEIWRFPPEWLQPRPVPPPFLPRGAPR